MLLAHSVQVVGDLVTLATEFMMTVSGFVEVVSRAFLREQTVPKTILESRRLATGMQRTRAVNFLRPQPWTIFTTWRLRATTEKCWSPHCERELVGSTDYLAF